MGASATTKENRSRLLRRRMRAFVLLLVALLAAGCAAAPPGPDAPEGARGEGVAPALAWRDHAAAPLPFAEVAVAQRGAEAWLVGGFTEAGGGSPLVLVYDLQNDTWRQGPPYPLPVHHAQAAFVDGRLLVFGGYVTGALLPGTFVAGAGPAGWPRTDLAFALDPAAGRWEPLPRLPAARAAGAAAVLDGKVYLVGGAAATGGYIAEVHVFDPAAGTYAEAPPLPTPRDHLTAMVDGGRLYALAGRVHDDAAGAWDDLETAEAYDPATLAWTTLPPAPLGRGGQAGAPFLGLLPLFGGERAEGDFTVYDAAHALAPANATWIPLPTLPHPRHGMGAAAWGDRVFLLGGATEAELLATVASLGPDGLPG